MAVPGEVAHPDRLRPETVDFESEGAQVDGYLARPAEPGPAAGIVVVHEIFGLVEHARDVARRFANVGYDALAPNLYARGASPPPDDLDAARAKGQALPDEQVVRDLEQAAAYLRRSRRGGREGRPDRLLLGWPSDAARQRARATRSTRQWTAGEASSIARAQTPKRLRSGHASRSTSAPELRCPLYAVFGENDQNPSPEIARELERRLASASPPTTIEVFENAGHAFFADYRQTYVEKAAFALWPKVLAFFEAHLRG